MGGNAPLVQGAGAGSHQEREHAGYDSLPLWD